jgi:hypothetical protein
MTSAVARCANAADRCHALDEFPRRGNHASRMELEKQNREANMFWLAIEIAASP